MADHKLLSIKKIGFYASLVDSGRRNIQARGYSQSGALDAVNFSLANAILGQDLKQTAIELVGGNFHCTFNQTCIICITGADTQVQLNDSSINSNCAIKVYCGDSLRIGGVVTGLVNYIGIRSLLRLPLLGQSICAVAREQSGGLHQDGKGLITGDVINSKTQLNEQQTFHAAFPTAPPQFSNRLKTLLSEQLHFIKKIKICLAYQANLFTAQQISQLTINEYIITKHVDRMGMRLDGKSIRCNNNKLASQAITYGAIQMTGDGQPIIMRNDRQTIGGYPVIATVSRLGMAILGQAVAGQKVQFTLSDFEKCRQQSLLIDAEFQKISAMQAQFLIN